jgi:hypothetical protein
MGIRINQQRQVLRLAPMGSVRGVTMIIARQPNGMATVRNFKAMQSATGFHKARSWKLSPRR